MSNLLLLIVFLSIYAFVAYVGYLACSWVYWRVKAKQNVPYDGGCRHSPRTCAHCVGEDGE